MTRIMRDSTTPADIPVAGTDLAAGYVNGSYAWPAAGWARFGVPHVTIDVNGSHPEADVLDVETGDATPPGAVAWVKVKLAMKPAYPPVIYCNRSTLAPLLSAMAAAGFHVVTHFRLWIATLDGTKTVADMTGVTAVQAKGEKQTGAHFDESIVYDPAWKASAQGPLPAGWQATLMLRLGSPAAGDANPYRVDVVQSLANLALKGAANWTALAVDGSFGPFTAGGVRRVQQAHGLAATGVVDPRTWAVLLTGASL